MSKSEPIHVLCMEDDSGLARLIQKKLERAGYSADLARDGEEGLAMYAAGSYSVVVADHVMPIYDGLEVIRTLASRGPLPPTIMITGSGDEQIAVEAMKLGARDYIVKDTEGRFLELLPAVIERVLQQRRLAEEKQRAEEERERLLVAEREQRLLAETLREVTLALTSQTSHAVVLDEILRQVQRLVPYGAANIALLEGDTLHVARWQGYSAFGSQELIASLAQPLTDFPLDEEVVRSQSPLVVPDTQQEPRWVTLDGTAWIRSCLAVPICLRDRVLGLLRLDSNVPGEFSAEDVKRLQPLANAAAIAIENSRLVEDLEKEVVARMVDVVAEQEKSATILRSVGDAICMSDLEMRIQYVNAAFTTLTGYPTEEVIGWDIGFLFGEAMTDQERQSIQSVLAEDGVWQGETTGRRKDGRTYDAALTIVPMRDAQSQLLGYVSSHHNISHRKDLDRARNRFITNISHQLRTPVTTIKLNAYLLRKGDLPNKADYYLQIVDDETARLIHLIQDILEIATLDSGQAVTGWESLSLRDVIQNAVTYYQGQAEAAGLTLVAMSLPPDLPVVKGDQARLAQALRELVENALTFTPAGGQVTAEVGTVENEGRLWVTITVRDTGPGISAEEQERIFDRFYRGSLAESGHIPGTGLGLSIVQEIMHAHGGRATVESKVGEGSIFKLWLLSDEPGT